MTLPQSGNSQSFIHYETERSDYSLTKDELNELSEYGKSSWKDFCLVSISLGIPCLINAIAQTQKPFTLTFSIFANYLIGFIGIGFSIFFGIIWKKENKNKNELIEKIQNKPKIPISISTTGSSLSDKTIIINQ